LQGAFTLWFFVGRVVTTIPAFELVFQMIGRVTHFERSLIGKRVKSGLANAEATGKVLGRPALRTLTPAETSRIDLISDFISNLRRGLRHLTKIIAEHQRLAVARLLATHF
jgi:DNA invertase Pin-like site-specific DNA recombinase